MFNVSSPYARGLETLLMRSRVFEEIIAEYIIRVNSKYFSNVFPSTQLTKVVLGKLQERKTKFPIVHRIVREILKRWEQEGVCIHVTTTKYSKSRTKTKEVYKFHRGGLQVLKDLIIQSTIDKIKGEIDKEQVPTDSLKTREEILEEFNREIEDFFEAMETESETEGKDN
ncbi:MAG: hypothetical protein Kow0069_01230 [Promethearchaeota archaeon]